MLKVRGLTVKKPTLEIQNINLDLNRGEALILIGPNGGGKSALLERIADPEADYEGTVSLHHFTAKEQADKFRSQIGYLPQNFLPPLHLTGFEYLEMVASLYYLERGDRKKEIQKYIEYYQLHDQIYQTLEHVSRSTRQVIGIIASLLAESPVIIWDEPTTYMDYSRKIITLSLLEKHLKAGRSALIATNDLAVAEVVGSYFMLVDEGQVVAEGTLAQLAHQAQTRKELGAVYEKLLGA